MSKKTRILISCILVVFAFGAGVLTYAQSYGNRTEIANAEGGGTDYFVDEFGKIDVPAGGTSAEAKLSRGKTAENPFMVLEIVPYEGIAHFGYMIEGCEPVDIERMCWDGKVSEIYAVDTLYTRGTKDYYFWDGQVPDGYTGTTTATTNQCGIMTFVGIGAGDYSRDEAYEAAPEGYTGTTYAYDAESDTYTEDASGTFIRRDTFTKTTGGDFNWNPLTLEECLALTEDEVYEYKYASQETASFKACFDNVTYHYRLNVDTLTHKNMFLRESVGLAYKINAQGKREALSAAAADAAIEQYKDFYVVYTVTPEDLNINPELIDRADLIYFASKENTNAALNAYNGGYKKEELFSRAALDSSVQNLGYNNPSATFGSNPISWEVAVKIYERVNDSVKVCPVLWDTQTRTDVVSDGQKSITIDRTFSDGSSDTRSGWSGTQNNLYKLYLMLYQMSGPTFETLYGSPSTFATTTLVNGKKDRNGNVLETGLLSQYNLPDAKNYWTDFSLYPWNLCPSGTEEEYTPVLNYLGIMGDYPTSVYKFAAGDAQNLLRNNILLTNGSTQYNNGFLSDSGVQDNQYGCDAYDFFDSIGVPKTTLTTAECLYYLLNGITADTAPTQEEYRILELQPSPMNYKEQSFWNLMIATYTNSVKPPVVTKMTTSEFIGKKVECISDYDMIYIGMNKLSTDPTMSGTSFTYAHTGPRVSVSDSYKIMYGWLGTNQKNIEKHFVYSGNDLTEKAMEKLEEFADAGSALMFGTGFFDNAAATNVADKIDHNSYMYTLQDSVSDKIYEAALSDSSTHVATKTVFKDALSKSRRVELLNLTTPKLYDGEKTDAEKYINNADGSGSRVLTFTFKLKAPTSKTYTAELYVDINGDGTFATNEKIGATVSPSSTLLNGNTYTITRPVLDRVGSVSWKLDIVNGGVVYASETGVSAIKATAAETIDLRILQIVETDGTASVYLPQAGEVTNDSVTGEPTTAEEVTKLFHYYTKNINGMNIEFVRMKESEILTKLSTHPDYLLDGTGVVGDDGFDMLILGFADCYVGVTDSNLYDAIQDYMDKGRAVLFTHDNSSLIGDGGWGQEFTNNFRDLFGMDRYDVLAYHGAAGKTRSDYPYKAMTSRDLTEMETANNKLLTQGVTNGTIFRYAVNSSYNVKAYRATQVNAGAITEYPYKIAPTISTAETHAQYYQLDYTRDDIVVWYCLQHKEGETGNTLQYYSSTPNDVRNNYYIYNVKNVTYSGVGHKGILTRDEIRLFVNTFVAAYRAAAAPVSVIIENNDKTKIGGGDTYYLCVDVDSEDSDRVFGNDIVESYRLQEEDGEGYKSGIIGYKLGTTENMQAKRVYFRVINNSSYGDPDFKLDFYVNDSTHTTKTLLPIFRVSDDLYMDMKTTATKLEHDVEYYVDVPIALEQTVDAYGAVDHAVITTMFDICTVMGYGDEGEETDPVWTEVEIMPRGLFKLD